MSVKFIASGSDPIQINIAGKSISDVRDELSSTLKVDADKLRFVHAGREISDFDGLDLTARDFIFVDTSTKTKDESDDDDGPSFNIQITRDQGQAYRMMLENDPSLINDIIAEMAHDDAAVRNHLMKNPTRVMEKLGVNMKMVNMRRQASKRLPKCYRKYPVNIMGEDLETHVPAIPCEEEEEAVEEEEQDELAALAKKHNLTDEDKEAIRRLSGLGVEIGEAAALYLKHDREESDAAKGIILMRLLGGL